MVRGEKATKQTGIFIMNCHAYKLRIKMQAFTFTIIIKNGNAEAGNFAASHLNVQVGSTGCTKESNAIKSQ